MDSPSKEKLKLLLSILLTLISVVIAYLLSQIDDSFYLYVETIIPYKWLLILLTLSILFLLYSIVYHLMFSNAILINKKLSTRELKRNAKDSEKEREKIMKNLSANEKLKLLSFFKQQTKSLVLHRDGTLVHLVENSVLNCPFVPKELTNEDTFVLNDWAWEYINEHKKELGIRF